MAAGGAVGSGMTEAIPQEGVEPLTPPLQATASEPANETASEAAEENESVSDELKAVASPGTDGSEDAAAPAEDDAEPTDDAEPPREEETDKPV